MGHLAWCCSVRDRSLGMGRLHVICWSSVTLSAKVGKAVSQSLPIKMCICQCSIVLGRFVYRNAACSTVEC